MEIMNDKPGVFIDIGAGNGVNGSNTFLLEKNGWSGLCIEPNPILWNYLINESQRRCLCVKAVVYSCEKEMYFHFDSNDNQLLTKKKIAEKKKNTGKESCVTDHLVFEVEEAPSNHSSYGGSGLVDTHHLNVEKIKPTLVKTITFEQILDTSKFTKKIDLIDIDVEGAEYDILSSFDFDKYTVRIICAECADDKKEKLGNLLTDKGFELYKKLGNDYIYINKKVAV